MNALHESNSLPVPSISRDDNPAALSSLAKRRYHGSAGGGATATTDRTRGTAAGPDQIDGEEILTFGWADSAERKRVIVLALQEGRQTMNLRTRKGAELVVLRRSDGELIGWTGVDITTDPARPELFSQFVFPRYRGVGLGALLEHFWWAYLDRHGHSTGFMRMELDSNGMLVERRLHSGYCRCATPEELGEKFVTACHNCELFGTVCHRQIFLAVDVQKALAARRRCSGPLDINSLPLRVAVEPKTLN